MNANPVVTVAPATYGGWLAVCSTCEDFRRWCVTRPPLDALAIEHWSRCGKRGRD